MGHPRWPGFDTKTGKPNFDNQARRMNRIFYRETKKGFRVTAGNRKRKKHIKRIEGGRYIALWAAAITIVSDRTHETSAH